jgi:lysophospholipase L1-like esterase
MARMRDSYVRMIAAARAAGVEPIIATEITTPTPSGWSTLPARIAGAIRGRESYQAWVNRHVLAGDLWLRELARAEGLQVLDLQAALASTDGARRPEFATPDGSHISPAGYSALTAYASPWLQRHLESR